jgi:hypothetical protein
MDQRALSISEDPTSAELARHIITFDPDAPQDRLFSALAASPRAHLAPIPWPAGLAPQVTPAATPPTETDPLPEADVLVVTWTVAEAKALADVLDANARAVEMGDAVLGLVCAEDLHDPPPWAIVRNASDPQIDGAGSLAEQAQQAAQIYEKYGYWTTVGSAIACWALIAAAES